MLFSCSHSKVIEREAYEFFYKLSPHSDKLEAYKHKVNEYKCVMCGNYNKKFIDNERDETMDVNRYEIKRYEILVKTRLIE